MRRRKFLQSGVALAAGILAFPSAGFSERAERHRSGQKSAFDFAWLKGHARSLAERIFQPPPITLSKQILSLDYDGYQAIRFRPERSLWSGQPVNFRIQFFPRGPSFREQVRMYEVVDGAAQEIRYNPAMLDFRKSGADAALVGEDLGFAGFRVQYRTDWKTDIASFLGASYFRAVGGDQRQYGLSARGLAVNTALEGPEEFPRFTAFWFVRPPQNSRRLEIYALLDSPSVAGAYRFDVTPGATTEMEVDAALYPRKTIERFGVGALTSMFLCGENDRRVGLDWRPEIHDSDGLALFTGSGERIWRPLMNSPGTRVNSFSDENPRGFGLMQRDRNFDHYQDDGAFYERRPSLWVEPKITSGGGWGRGSVQLVELPAPDETYDNIVAYWVPAAKPEPTQEWLFSYRLHWGTQLGFEPSLARVVATRSGIGGVVGQKRRHFSWRFAVDFAGGELAALSKNQDVEPIITASRGEVEIPSARPQADIRGYRAMFDIKPTDDSIEPIDLRLYLRLHGQPLTETWLYQWTPPPGAERKF